MRGKKGSLQDWTPNSAPVPCGVSHGLCVSPHLCSQQTDIQVLCSSLTLNADAEFAVDNPFSTRCRGGGWTCGWIDR